MMATTSPQTCIETPANIVSARAVPTPEVSAEQPEKPPASRSTRATLGPQGPDPREAAGEPGPARCGLKLTPSRSAGDVEQAVGH